ncbi:MAG: tRNA (guanosine(37)-N1)-methyltransferase TrmD [Desulfobacterales bacterium]|nr:tRNA (guanosine(37)-N1)-methyltransferase TrmD [Desulfobacterales bacterium]
MHIAVLTIFPAMFDLFWEHGIVRRAVAGGLVQPQAVDIRAFTRDRHQVTDDRPYGGGCGMVMKPEPLARAIESVRDQFNDGGFTVLMTPRGDQLSQQTAAGLARQQGLIFICGRYEGVDARIVHRHVDYELSIGDYVLSGGELAAMVAMDAVIRLIPGVLGGAQSAQRDSFSDGLLEHEHYTRPRVFEGDAVPEILLSGDHQAIERWRRKMSLIETLMRRPDLLENRALDERETEILRQWSQMLERVLKHQAAHRPDSLPGRQ